ncbi:MAG: TetR/AcrR family transcriptional regulator C-terminal domain-containing protein [Halieaceae bacterium]|nr:TetR/AcrR family transcriptional regulator C-terminal domain-containing protein [Halieaceae bacterium]
MALGKEKIVACATEICEQSGFEAISMRSIAKTLGVTPMALYKHVKTKDELLNLVACEYLGLYRRKRNNHKKNPQQKVFEAFCEFKNLMLEKPILAHIIVRQPLDGEAAYRVGGELIGVLHECGFSEQKSAEVFVSLTSYTLGFVSVVFSRADTTNPASLESRKRQLKEHPYLLSLADFLSRLHSDHYFETGLKNMIASYEKELSAEVRNS